MEPTLFDPSSCKILFVVGGASLWRKMNTGNEDLAWALAEAGVEVHILAGGTPPEEHSYEIPSRVRYHFTQKTSGKAIPGDHVELFRELTQEFDFDFVIGWMLYLEPILRDPSTRRAGTKFLANEGYISKDHRNTFSRFKHSIAALFGHEFTRSRGRGPVAAWKGLGSTGELIDFAVPISRAVMKNCREFYGIPEDKCKVIYGGVDLSLFAPDDTVDRRKLKSPPRLIFTGNIAATKGIMDVIDGMQFVDTPVEIVLCGNDKHDLLRQAEARLKSFNKGHNLVYKGSLGHDALAAELKASDIFVFCSWSEGLGKSLLEAMACGLPVIVSNIDVFGEFITDGSNGLVVPVKSPGSIAMAIESLLDDPELREKCGRGAVKTMENFSISKEAQQWIDLFSELKGSVS